MEKNKWRDHYKQLFEQLCVEERAKYEYKIERLFDDSFESSAGMTNYHEINGGNYVALEDYVRMEQNYIEVIKFKAMFRLPKNILKRIGTGIWSVLK